MRQWIADRIGLVRLRQIIEDVTHRIAFVPIAMMIVALVASQATLAIDRAIDDVDVPVALATTVDSARAIFASIAGGLITAVTLVLSMMLVAVQLASGQFSPRTLRNWLGDPPLRRAVGVILGTVVFCLMGLRSARETGTDDIVPTVTVLLAVLLGVASLIAMIRAVDHLTRSLQVGTVAKRLTDETIRTIETTEGERANEAPSATASFPAGSVPSSTARPVESTTTGWVQQIDEPSVAAALPHAAQAWVVVAHGTFVTTHRPLVMVEVPEGGDLDDGAQAAVRAAFALGPNRTMQQDVGFGLQQLTDIAVRALSPGINDPETASDIVVHLGEVLQEIWSHPRAESRIDIDGVSIHRLAPGHGEHLRAALDPIRHAGRSDPRVLSGIADVLIGLRGEVQRRGLPGPVEPIDDFLGDLADGADDAHWLERERAELVERCR